jgi:hypothetical protein
MINILPVLRFQHLRSNTNHKRITGRSTDTINKTTAIPPMRPLLAPLSMHLPAWTETISFSPRNVHVLSMICFLREYTVR